MTPHVRLTVGWLVGLSVKISRFTLHTPIGALVFLLLSFLFSPLLFNSGHYTDRREATIKNQEALISQPSVNLVLGLEQWNIDDLVGNLMVQFVPYWCFMVKLVPYWCSKVQLVPCRRSGHLAL